MLRFIKILVFLIFVFLSGLCIGQEPDAIFRKQVREYILNSDGSITFHYYHRLLIKSHFAFHREYGEDRITYNTKYQTLKVNFSRTTTPQGKIVPSPANAYNEVLPNFCVNAPAYNHIRSLVVTHTALEVGSVIEIDYTITSQKGFYPTLTGNELLLNSSPSDSLIFSLTVPKQTSLFSELINSEVQYSENSSETKLTRKWIFTACPALSKESFVPQYKVYPYLVFSTIDHNRLALMRIVMQPAFRFQPDDKMLTLVSELKTKYSYLPDLGFQIQKIVASEVKTYPIPTKFTGYTLQSPVEVFSKNGGTPLEKACLMATLLQAAGIRAFPVLAGPEELYRPNIGNLSLFDEVYVRASFPSDEGNVLYPVDKALTTDMFYKMKGKVIYPVQIELIETVTKAEVKNPYFLITGSFIIDNELITKGKVNAAMSRSFYPRFDVFSGTKIFLKKLFEGISVDSILDVSLAMESGYLSFELSAAGWAEKDNDLANNPTGLVSWKIPLSPMGIESWHLPVLTGVRLQPFMIPDLLSESYSYSLKLPRGYKMITPPYQVHIKNDIGELSLSLSRKGNKYLINRKIIFYTDYVEIMKYSDFRDLISHWRVDSYRTLIMKNTKIR